MHQPRSTSPGGPYATLTSTSTERSPPGANLSVPPASGRYAKQPRAPRGGTPAAPGAGATGDLAPRGEAEEAETAGYTFYREGTPTPSDRSVETGWQKRRRVSARVSRRVGVVLSSVGFPAIERAESAGAGAGGGTRGPGGSDDGDRERRKRVCGVPLGMFWCLVIGLGMVVIGLGVGLGLGLGLKSGGDEAESAA